MTRKDMRRSDWHRVLKKTYCAQTCRYEGRYGIISLSVLQQLTAPLTISYDFGDLRIADCGYAWLQCALQDESFWITAMFDEKGHLIEVYLDITAGNDLSDPENPCFEDLYLDIVLLPDGAIWVLDRDELDEALQNHSIDAAQYHRAIQTCDRLYTYLEKNSALLLNFCRKWYEKLKEN